MAFLRYEERIRIERANGLRKDDVCTDQCGCKVQDYAEYVGKGFGDVANTPLRLNRVCPHPKVVVPVVPAFVVNEPVTQINSTYPTRPYKLVDANPCDGRLFGVMDTIASGHEALDMVHATSTSTHTTKVVDTVYDEPVEVTVIKHGIVEEAQVEQPLLTGETTATVNIVDIDDKDGING